MRRSIGASVSGSSAVFKAGAAYLPLDPEYPRERLAFMLRDAAPPVILATGDETARAQLARRRASSCASTSRSRSSPIP